MPGALSFTSHQAQTLLDDLTQTLQNQDPTRLHCFLTPNFTYEEADHRSDRHSFIRQALDGHGASFLRLEVLDVEHQEALIVRAIGLASRPDHLESTTLEFTLIRIRNALRVHALHVQKRFTSRNAPLGATHAVGLTP